MKLYKFIFLIIYKNENNKGVYFHFKTDLEYKWVIKANVAGLPTVILPLNLAQVGMICSAAPELSPERWRR